MKRSKIKMDLTKSEVFFHYSVLLFLAVLPLSSVYYLYGYFTTRDYSGPRKSENFYVIGGIGLFLMIVFF